MTSKAPLAWMTAGLALGLIVFGLYRYPLAPWVLAGALALYAAALWRWPGIWLVAVPALIPTYDLAPWTGWLVVGEADFFILATICVLSLRAPPGRADLLPARPAWAALLPFLFTFALAVAAGLAHPGPPDGTDNPYMSGWETIRLALPLAGAMALMPFARARDRDAGDALMLFSFGMVAGLGLVSAIVVLERIAFPGLWDFVDDYRVVGSFSSMHIGGGHIGAYIALSLPFLNVCVVHRRAWSLALLGAVAALAAYALLVTFARTAYAAAIVGAVVAAYGAPVAAWVLPHARGAGGHGGLRGRLLPLAIGIGVLSVGFGTVYMSGRMETIPRDFGIRVSNWLGGMALGQPTVANRIVGFGLGTFPRVAAATLPADSGPSNYRLVHARDGASLRLEMKRKLYFGQKIRLTPGAIYHVRLRVRTPRAQDFGILLCEKLLLYSQNCQSARFSLVASAQWQDREQDVMAPGTAHGGWTMEDLRPVEFSLSLPNASVLEVAAISLRDAAGNEMIANGAFAHGLDRWFFTDDNHLSWRIKDQYLTTMFETGALGCATFLIFGLGGFLGAAARMGRGDPLAACVAPALAAIAMSGMFDAVLEAPHVASMFYLIALFGLDWLGGDAREASRKLQTIPDAVIAAPSSTSASNRSP